MPFPMNLMHLFMKGKLSRDFDEGLGLLKPILEHASRSYFARSMASL